MFTFEVVKVLSNKTVEVKRVNYDEEQKAISDLFHNQLIDKDIREIIELHNKDLALKYFPEDDSTSEYISIIISYDNFNMLRPTILFTGSDFPNETEIIKAIKIKVAEYQKVFDEIWKGFLTKNEITG